MYYAANVGQAEFVSFASGHYRRGKTVSESA